MSRGVSEVTSPPPCSQPCCRRGIVVRDEDVHRANAVVLAVVGETWACSVWILLPVTMKANDTPPRPVHVDDVSDGAITQACYLYAPEHGRLDRTWRVGPAASIGETVELALGGDGATSF